MKSNEKKGLLILIGVAIVIILIVWLCTRSNNNNQNNNQSGEKTQQEISQGEFTKKEADGTIVNTSDKLKETKTQEGFKISDIKFTDNNGHTVLKAKVTNKTDKSEKDFMADIVLLDKQGKEIGRIPVSIPETQSGETVGIQAGITASYANAYDFRLERK